MHVLVSTFIAIALLGPGARAESGDRDALRLTSSAFTHGGEIPVRYTCDGDDVSLPLTWSGLPEGTRTLALVVDDPDAANPRLGRASWVHWVVYNIPPESGGLAEKASPGDLPAGAREGLNDWKRTGYGGPCPPRGRHRYLHVLYALDAVLSDLAQPTKAALLEAMEGHVLGRFELVGTYQR